MDKTILVVDDDLGFAANLAPVLEGEGHRVLLAKDSSEAVAAFERDAGRIALAIVDLALPGSPMSGPELIATISRRRFMDGLTTRVVATTGVFKRLYLDTMLQLGADAVLVKPGSGEEWVRTVRQVLIY